MTCIYNQNSSDNNQTQCTLVQIAERQQRFSVSIQKQATLTLKSFAVFEFKFTTTTAPGSRLIKITKSVLTNVTFNYIIQIEIIHRKDCLITYPVSNHKPQPGKALRQLVYISSNEKYT